MVGVCENSGYDTPIYYDEEGKLVGGCSIYTTQSVLENHCLEDMPSSTEYVWFCCKNTEEVVACIEQLNLIPTAVYSIQDQARSYISTQNTNKLYTVVILVLILGVNLYSSFQNALSERKFEIGVRQALGASPGNIIRQFMLESFLVMAANVLLSVVLVADALILYKFIQWTVYGETWIAEISAYSVAMFGVCSVSLTALFSGVFAYKASRVEIVKHLKAE